jgi:hypothetical protein
MTAEPLPLWKWKSCPKGETAQTPGELLDMLSAQQINQDPVLSEAHEYWAELASMKIGESKKIQMRMYTDYVKKTGENKYLAHREFINHGHKTNMNVEITTEDASK